METEKLATLVSMGFDIDLCEAILKVENLTLEEAIQRLLDVQKSQDHEHELASTQPSGTSSLTAAKEAMKIPIDGTTREDDGHVTSRLALSDRQKEIKKDFERKEREEVEVSVKKRRIQAKHEKGFILQEIEANKKRVKELRNIKDVSQVETANSEQESKTILTDGGKSDFNVCKIQIRLPSGRVINSSFQKTSSLNEVIDFAVGNIQDVMETNDPILIQPFPRREFTRNDSQLSLQSLGLYPNASLVLLLKKDTHQSGSSCIVQKESSSSHSYDGDRTSNVHSVHHSPQVQFHDWGGGNRLCGDNEELNIPDNVQSRGRSRDVSQSALLRSVLGNSLDSSRSNIQGEASGDRLLSHTVTSTAADSSRSNDERDRKNAMMKAIEKRNAQHKTPDVNIPKVDSMRLEREIHPLVQLCADCVANYLAAQNGSILSFIGKTLSHQAASQVIEELKKRKLLTGKLLQLFHPCKLRSLDLDCYSLTSNEILEAARLHSTLTSLVLSQCTLITDTGVVAVVRGLKHLQVLDLSGCVQVTDKSLFDIKDLCELRSLKLDNTKIKDSGMQDFLNDVNRTRLTELSLNSTGVTENGFSCLGNVTKYNLRVLLLDRTKVSSLEFLRGFTQLRHVSLSGTPLRSGSIPAISSLRQLEELNLSYTTIPDGELQHIVDLPLRIFAFPDRLVITDAGLRYIEGLSLTSLDLSDYIHITDTGAHSIGKISSLTSLSLANTKVTDAGIHHLKGLSCLQELDLGRTAVTDAGIRILKGLRSLHTLGLASTHITNEIFLDGTINSFKNLVKLNVSRNKISDKGVRCLLLMFLEVINADQTYTTSSLELELTGCPSLKALRARNCKPMSQLADDE